MTVAETQRLTALLIELENDAHKAVLCAQHTRYVSSSAEAVKKYRRTDADVRAWLDRLDGVMARIAAARGEVRDWPRL